ncbi:CD209 antigen-like protein E isoform X3 [Simochromis diagramma]|uniref:CD209 antigen-like protein E isoform X3 n=1 Tax=Simochromis diagramma TaxID=43689 RepID=UPI001A7E57AF|nr:CD209 antigen-like protein E isoform X3 [Simochromis diagramma]
MSTEIQSVEDFRVKYSRGSQEDGGVREQSEVEVLDDGEQHPDVGLQEADEHFQKNVPASTRSWLRVFEVNLGVLYLLMLAAITTRYILVTLDKEQLQNRNNELSNNFSLLANHSSQLQEEVKQLKEKMEEKCPDRWTRFGSSCYFKSTEAKHWQESRRACQDKGADLVMINSREEQEFVSKFGGESWIGLERTSPKHEWKWMDGSLLTETFWAAGQQSDSLAYYAACCDNDGRWTQSSYESKTFICEK